MHSSRSWSGFIIVPISIGLAIVVYGLSSSSPLVKFGFVQHDFGSVPQKSRTSVFLPIKNLSKGAVDILDITTTCSCTTAGLTPSVIESGDSCEVEFVFDAGESRGPRTEHALLRYRIKGLDEVFSKRLLLKATVIPDYSVEPETIFVKTLSEKFKQSLIIRSSIKDFKVTDALASSLSLDCKLRRLDEAEYAVDVFFDPTKAPEFSGDLTVTIETNSELQPRYALFIQKNKQESR